MFNCVAGGLGMWFPVIGVNFVTGVETTAPAVLFIFFMLCFAVALFGLGCLLVAINTVANRGFVLVGAIGKISFFAMGLYGYLHGLSTLIFTLLVGVDLVWAALFIFYLSSTKRAAGERQIYV